MTRDRTAASGASVAIPAGVEQDTRLCWLGYDDLGRPHDNGEGEVHYYERSQVPDHLSPRQQAQPCWGVTCVGCDYRLDEYGAWVTHFDTAQEAAVVAQDYEWLLIDGSLYCSAECEGLPSASDDSRQDVTA